MAQIAYIIMIVRRPKRTW